MRLKHVEIIPFTKPFFVLLFPQLPAQQRFSKLLQGQKHIIWISHLTCLLICEMKITKHHVVFCSAYIPLNNYLVFNDVDGLYTYTFEAQRKVCCVLQITQQSLVIEVFGARRITGLRCYCLQLAGKLFSLQPGASGPSVSSFSQTTGGIRLPYWERLSVSTLEKKSAYFSSKGKSNRDEVKIVRSFVLFLFFCQANEISGHHHNSGGEE